VRSAFKLRLHSLEVELPAGRFPSAIVKVSQREKPLLPVDDQQLARIPLFGKKNTRHWQAKKQGLHEARSVFDVPDEFALKFRNVDRAIPYALHEAVNRIVSSVARDCVPERLHFGCIAFICSLILQIYWFHLHVNGHRGGSPCRNYTKRPHREDVPREPICADKNHLPTRDPH